MHRFPSPLLALALLLPLAGCDRDEIKTYSVAKEPKPAATPGTGAPQAPAPVDVTWTLPASWKEVPTEEPMRLATFAAGDDQILVSAFPGDVGGVAANVNRWRGQLGLEQATEKDIAPMLTTQTIEGVTVSTLRIVGTTGADMLAAIITPGDGRTWFVKCTTAAASATKLEPDFLTFCRSFRRGGAPTPQAPAPVAQADGSLPDDHPPLNAPITPRAGGSLPSDHPPVNPGGAVTPTPPAAGSPVITRLSTWTAPADWKATPDSSGIAAAVFEVPGADGPARATLTSLLGDGGGNLANINRWRNQLGLAPMADLAAQPTVDLGGGAVLVHLVDQAGARAMSAAIVPDGAQTWFFKLSGPAGAVGAHKDAFTAFVREVGAGGGAK